ncbi:hypothetical protein OROHE_014692 [Orobanche hederae]
MLQHQASSQGQRCPNCLNNPKDMLFGCGHRYAVIVANKLNYAHYAVKELRSESNYSTEVTCPYCSHINLKASDSSVLDGWI